jgi:hypothetical protein
MDHEEVFERVTLLLATVILLWLFWIVRAVDRTFGALMPKRGGGPPVRRGRCAHCGKLCNCSGRKPLVACSGLIQHRMLHVNPCVRMRSTHPTELSLYLLHGMLFQVGQPEELLVRDRGPRTGAIGTVAATRAGLPINRAVMPVGHKGLLNMGQQGLQFGVREPGQRSSTPGTLGDLFITWHRYLPPALSCLWKMVRYKP